MSHMLCIGYGLTAPMTLEEAWVVNVSMILGASLFAVFGARGPLCAPDASETRQTINPTNHAKCSNVDQC